MNEHSSWDLIKMQRFEEACVRAEADYRDTGDHSLLRNKVIALLHLARFDAAVQVSEQILTLAGGTTDTDFIFCGVAKWLKGDQTEAIALWRRGLNTKYTDAAGGVEVPMLLLFAAVKAQDEKVKQEASTRLRRLSRSKRVLNWPGPVAQYLIGALSEGELRSCLDSQPVLHEKQACQAEFYIGLKHLISGEREKYRENMVACASYGLLCSMKPELHLARAEIRS